MRDNRLVIALTAMVVILLGALLLSQYQKKQAIEQLNDQVKTAQTKANDESEKIDELQANKVQRYTVKSLNDRSKKAKPTVDNFFKALDQWDNGNEWSQRVSKAEKYTNDKQIVENFVGGKGDKKANEEQAKSLNANHAKQKINETHWYSEKSNGNKVTGLYLIKTTETIGGDEGTHNTQMFKVTEDLENNKITAVSPMSLE